MCLECCSRVTSTLQTMCGFSFFSTSIYFCSRWCNIPFFNKGLHIHMCYPRLGPFDVIIKVILKVYKLNTIVDGAFFLLTIVIYFLRHPTLISKSIRMNNNWFDLCDTLDTWSYRRITYLQRLTQFVGYDVPSECYWNKPMFMNMYFLSEFL